MTKFFAALMAFLITFLSWFGINLTPKKDPDLPVTEPTTVIVSDPPEEFKPVIGEPVREDAYRSNIAFGCSYVKDREPHENYPDTYGRELTDGVYSYPQASYTNASLSGYVRLWDTPMVVDVHLQHNGAAIYSFEVSYLATDGAGINIPESVCVSISQDGEVWTSLGSAVIEPEIDGTIKQAVLTLDEYVGAEFVRFSISATSAFVFLDEVMVYADVKPAEPVDFQAAVQNAYTLFSCEAAPTDGEKVNTGLEKVSVSKGKEYELSGGSVAEFADDGLMLTDGITGNTYESGAFAGLKNINGQTVTVILGETVNDIAGVEVYAYSRGPSGIYLPAAVKFTAISEDATRTVLGVRYPSLIEATGNYVFRLELEKTVSAEKIEITIAGVPGSELCLVEEVNVYAFRPGTATDAQCYEYVELSLADNGVWDEEEPDYNDYRNLLLGLPAQITEQGSMTSEQKARNTADDSGLLTDGVHSVSTNIYCGKYQIFYTGKSRQIVFDMQKPCAVEKLVCEFTNQTSWAVYAPAKVKTFLSENGCDWYDSGVMSVNTADDPAVVAGTIELVQPLNARYICFEFNINIFAGCSEIEAFGKKNTSDALGLSESGLSPVGLFENRRFSPQNSFLSGSKDTCLLYHGTFFGYSAQQLLPYVGYADKDGVITDTMFDSFLFLMSGSFPSGLSSATDGKLSDWKWCIDDLFSENENILALEDAAGQVKETLGLPEDFVYPFTVAVYCPNILRTDFGDIDSDGVNEDFSTDAGRIKALNAYADMFEQRLAQYDFKNIRFEGYYWMRESMDTANRDDVVARAFSEYVHERGYDFFWIPYNRANAYNRWQSFGFDCAVMQPNYVFSKETPYSYLSDCTALTQLYGMGVEMEVSNVCMQSDEYFKRYMKYLSDGVKYGYADDCVIMYYQDLILFGNASRSDSGRGRLIYDNTYSFIKGTLDIYPDKLGTQNFVCAKNTPFYSSLSLPESEWYDVIVTKQPEHGTLTLNSDGSFGYYPEKDFNGEVEFGFTYSVSFEQSEECTAIISVR